MTAAFIERVVGPVLRIEIARPAVRNALCPADLHALAAAIARYDTVRGVEVIVLSGQGERAFSAGLDLKNHAAILAELEGDGPTGLGAVLRQARLCRTPIVGRINGACVAGGMGLLAACHFTVAVESAIFALPEVRHGLYPHVVLAGWQGRKAEGALTNMARTGKAIDAREALRIGLVDQLAPAGRLDETLDALLENILVGTIAARAPPLDEAMMATAEARTRAHRFQPG